MIDKNRILPLIDKLFLSALELETWLSGIPFVIPDLIRYPDKQNAEINLCVKQRIDFSV